jgi:hypothetical protein
MTVEDYLDHLLKIGMGWLGWTEAQTLDTSMAAIVMAREGRIELLQQIFGDGRTAPEPAKLEPDLPDRKTISEGLKSALRSLKFGALKKGVGRN